MTAAISDPPSADIAFDFGAFENADRTVLASTMDRDGFAVIPGAIPPDALAGAVDFVRGEVARRKGEYFSLAGAAPIEGTSLDALGKAPGLQKLLADLAGMKMHRPVAVARPYQVLRVVAGESGRGQSWRFHFDAYAVTAVVPLVIPDEPGGPHGDLVIYPRFRGTRRSVARNIIEKALMQNGPAQRLMSRPGMQRRFGAKTLRIVPGNVYLFWGYQTLHANEPCLPTSLRATALFHVGDPHETSMTTRLVQRWRLRSEARRQKALAGA